MATDGAVVRSDDPALNDALSELVADGVDLNAASTLPSDDLPTPTASQPADDGAPLESAQPAPTGDATADPAPGDPVVDPLAGTEPYTYGDAKTAIEGVYRVPGEGLLVPEERVASFDRFVTTLEQTARDQFEKASRYERLSEWHTQDSTGKDVVLRGEEALKEMRMQVVRQAIEIQTYESVFKDPNSLINLLARDEAGNFQIDSERLRVLALEMTLQQQAAEQAVAKDFTTRLTPPAQPASTPDYATQYGAATITALAGTNAAHLTAEDRAELLAQFNRYVAPDGKSIAPEFKRLVEYTAGKAAKTTQALSAAEKAGKHNTGMESGRKAKVVTPPAPAAKVETRPTNQKADWDTPLKDAMDELAIPMR